MNYETQGLYEYKYTMNRPRGLGSKTKEVTSRLNNE